jgi:hypothetical protein
MPAATFDSSIGKPDNGNPFSRWRLRRFSMIR